MACRGCSSDGCNCSVTGDNSGIDVSGSGTPITDPYVISFDMREALDALADDNTACDLLNSPRVPAQLNGGSVVMVPLPCPADLLEPALSGQAFAFTWDSATGSSPADGRLRANNAAMASVTTLYVSEQETGGTDISGWLAALDTISGSPKGMIKLYLRTDPTIWASFRVTAVAAGVAGVQNITVEYVDHSGALSGAIIGNTVLDFAPASEGSTGAPGADGADGGFNSVQEINTVAASTYTFVLADAGKYVRLNDASPITLTVPLNASVAFPVGTHIDISQIGAGQVTVSPTGGVTVNASPGLKTSGQWSAASLIKVGTDEWDMFGDLTA